MQSVLAWRCCYIRGLRSPSPRILRPSCVFVPSRSAGVFICLAGRFFRSGECGRVILRPVHHPLPLQRKTPNARCYRLDGRRNAIVQSPVCHFRHFFRGGKPLGQLSWPFRGFLLSARARQVSAAEVVFFWTSERAGLVPRIFARGLAGCDPCAADMPLRQSAQSNFPGPVLSRPLG